MYAVTEKYIIALFICSVSSFKALKHSSEAEFFVIKRD
jgi:hypothetical protein